MNKFVLFVTLLAFGASPVAFGNQLTAEQIYKNTYVSLKKGEDAGKVINDFMKAAKENNLTAKEILEAAVKKGYMSQAQLNTVLDLASKNSALAKNDKLVGKAKVAKVSQKDVLALASSLQGDVTGAAYYCGYYGCYYHGNATLYLAVLILVLLMTPVYVVVY